MTRQEKAMQERGGCAKEDAQESGNKGYAREQEEEEEEEHEVRCIILPSIVRGKIMNRHRRLDENLSAEVVKQFKLLLLLLFFKLLCAN